MIDPRWQKIEVTDFSGPQSLLEAFDARALAAENVEFVLGKVSTRLGFGVAYALNEPAKTLFNWLSSLGNYLVWFRPGVGVRALRIGSAPSAPLTIAPFGAGVGASFATSGPRLYAAFFDAQARSASQGVVISFQGGNFVADKLFAPPMTYTPPAPTETDVGLITAGQHRLGYVVEHRSGFIGRPSPDSGAGSPSASTFQPVVVTASGGKNLSWTLDTVWPPSAVRVHVVMTPVSNPNKYIFVPGASADLPPGGGSASVTIVWSISDEDLQAIGAEATDLLFLMTQDASGNGPIEPSVVFPYGNRMVYIATVPDSVGNRVSAAFVSDPNHYQRIAADTSIVQLPGQLDIVTGFVLRGTLYLVGPHWIYATHDVGGDPASWPAPVLVDGRRGTLSPYGVSVSPTGNYSWIASDDGLYVFDGGALLPTPISYYNQEWRRINWSAGTLQIRDDPASRRVYVLAPLDDAVEPSHLLVWDYTRGLTPEAANFSLDSINGFQMGSIELVQNDFPDARGAVTRRIELWVGSSADGPVLRRMNPEEPGAWRDNGLPILSVYETALLPGQTETQKVHHHGGFMRLTGSGTVAVSVRHVDGSWSQDLARRSLTQAPGGELFVPWHHVGERVSYRFRTDELDSRFVLSELSHFWTPFSRH